MHILSQQQVFERYDALPDNLRTVMMGDSTIEMLWTIGGAHHLREERIQKVARVVGYVFLGFIHIEDLAKEIAIETNIDRRLAEELAREIQVKLLAPVIPEIQRLYHYGSTSSSQAALPRAEIMRPSFAPPVSSDQPFILHEEPDLRQGFGGQAENERVRPREETLVRPTFYEETSDKRQESRVEGPAAARLEIGSIGEINPPAGREPRVGKTETEKIRVVHYSGPQTQIDPFSPRTSDKQQETRSVEPPKDIHPENIVDLKDLPK